MPQRTINYDQLVEQHLSILKNLQYKSGLFAASKKDASTGYDKSWLRDNFYECLAFLVIGDWETPHTTFRAILDILKKHEEKIDSAIASKPEYRHQYIHARFHPETFDEFWEEWGNKQNDSIGSILFMIGELEKVGRSVIESDHDRTIVQKLVHYLSTLEYWHDEDSGMWEEDEEIHASSVGACVAGLKNIRVVPGIHVDDSLIEKGQNTLRSMLPRESGRKFVDMALLSLVWPYNVVTPTERDDILENVEYHLVRNKGVMRYKNDHYYNKNPDGYSEEAEWPFGFCFLSIIYKKIGNSEKARYFEDKALQSVTLEGEVPELYFSNTEKYNENTPLGWAESMLVVTIAEINQKHTNESGL